MSLTQRLVDEGECAAAFLVVYLGQLALALYLRRQPRYMDKQIIVVVL